VKRSLKEVDLAGITVMTKTALRAYQTGEIIADLHRHGITIWVSFILGFDEGASGEIEPGSSP
jgi:hypothetical protein